MVKCFCTQHFYSLLVHSKSSACVMLVFKSNVVQLVCKLLDQHQISFRKNIWRKIDWDMEKTTDVTSRRLSFICLPMFISEKNEDFHFFFRHSNDIRMFSSLQKSYKQFLANFVFNSKKDLQKNSILHKNSSKTCNCQFRANDHLRFYFKQYY